MISFVLNSDIRPNLVDPNTSPRQYDATWPYTVPIRLLMYLQQAGIPYEISPNGQWYPVGIGWFDHTCDYFEIMPDDIRHRVREGDLRVLFYYHEGDNPQVIHQRLISLCDIHMMPYECFLFISANTANPAYFPDHEFFFRNINRDQTPAPINLERRRWTFTALNRTHKQWRANIMADLWRDELLDHAQWSYHTRITVPETGHPLDLGQRDGWNEATEYFLRQGEHWCDDNDLDAHNNHGQVNQELYQTSNCHIVLETLFDIENCDGTFITEKTFKCIKYGQPFVIVGPCGSLQALRDMGYRVFDGVIDNRYDTIRDNTQRWFALKEALKDIDQAPAQEWFHRCLPDVEHNQRIFAQRQHDPLNRLLEMLE